MTSAEGISTVSSRTAASMATNNTSVGGSISVINLAETDNGAGNEDELNDIEQHDSETHSDYRVRQQAARKLHDLPTFSGKPEE